jgi:PKD repeat protein
MKKYYFAGWLTLIMSFLAIQTNAQGCDVEFDFEVDNGIIFANAYGPGETSQIYWTMNGVIVGQGLSMVYTLCETGDYELCLQITSEDCEETYCQVFYAQGLCNNCPTAMEYTAIGCQYMLFQLFPGAQEGSVFWDFGDGEQMYTFDGSADHFYDEAGSYVVNAFYEGPDCPNGQEVELIVDVPECQPCPSFLNTQWITCDSMYFYLGDVAADSIFWEFGDGQVETTLEYSTAHLFDLSNYYEICAFIMGGPCDGQEVCAGVDAYCDDECDALFSVYEFGPGQYEVIPNSSNTQAVYTWFVDGVWYGEGYYYTLALTEPGYHEICLHVENEWCEDEYCIDLYVDSFDCFTEIFADEIDPYIFEFSPVSGCNDGLFYQWYVDGIYYSNDCVLTAAVTEPGWHLACLEIEGNGCFYQTCYEFYVPELTCPSGIFVEQQGNCGYYTFELYEVNDPTIEAHWTIDGASYGPGTWTQAYLEEGVHIICAEIAEGPLDCVGMTFCETIETPNCNIECESLFEVVYTEIPGYVEFENVSTWTGTPIFCWYVNDVFSGLTEDFGYQFTTNGTYEICLQVITENCEDWYCFTIVIDEFDENCPTSLSYNNLDCNSFFFVLDTEEWVFWDFGDGNTEWASGPVDHNFGWAGNFTVCAWMIGDDCPNGTEVCTEIFVSEDCFVDCEASFEVDPVEGNPGTYDFPNTSEYSGGTPIYCWYINGELIVISEDFSYSFGELGTYEVCLLLTTGDCESWFCETIVVEEVCDPCTVTVETTNYGGCQYGFSASIPYGDAEITWIISNGVTMTGAETSYVFNDPGVYTICAMATSANCPGGASHCFVLEVNCEFDCEANFEYYVGPNGYVEFYNNSTWNTSASFFWDYGDGTSSQIYDEGHFYEPGTYEVCLLIENEYCSDSICYTIYVPGTECPNEVIYDQVECGFYTFWVPGYENTEIYWDFSNGVSYWGYGFTEMEFQPGTYDVCVTIDGCDEICQFLFVEPCETECPTEFSCDLLDCGWSDFWIPGFENESVLWNFGDGTSEVSNGFIEHYFELGTYTVCAFIEGCETICQEVEILPCADCDLFTTYAYVENCGIMFTASAAAPDAIVTWNFGDGSEEVQGFNPIHFYAENGVYTVTINMTSEEGECDTDLFMVVDVYCFDCYDEMVVTEYDCPEFSFWIPGANDFEIFWDFGDGTYDEGVNGVDHAFPGDGTYLVCAEYYSDECNNWNYICETIVVTGCDTDCNAYFDVVVLEDQTVEVFNYSTYSDNSSFIWTLNGEIIWDNYNLYLDFLPADEYVLCLEIVTADGTTCIHCEDFTVGEDTGCAQMNLWVECLQMWDAEGTVEYEIFQDQDFVLGGGWDLSDLEYFASDSFCLEDGCYSATFYATGEIMEYLFFINLYAPDDAVQVINQTLDWENGTITIEFGVNSECFTQIDEVAADLFAMYPNPASDQVNLQIPTGSNINVVDLVGNLIFETKSSSEMTTLDVSNFSGGLYLVTVRHGGKAWTQRLEVLR